MNGAAWHNAHVHINAVRTNQTRVLYSTEGMFHEYAYVTMLHLDAPLLACLTCSLHGILASCCAPLRLYCVALVADLVVQVVTSSTHHL